MAKSLVRAALLGAWFGLPAVALFYLGQQLAGLPFVPFDLFDWLARVLPGGAITLGIDTMVRAIRGLGLGPISAVAKTLEQFTGIVLVVAVFGVLGAATAVVAGRSGLPGWRAGSLVGGVALVLGLGLEAARGYSGNLGLMLAWLALVLLSWGAAAGAALDAEAPPAAGAAGAAITRRAALWRILGGALAVTLSAWGLAWLLRAGQQATGSGRPLPQAPQATPPPGGTVPASALAPGTRPELTGNDSFYRIDIDTLPVVLQEAAWKLEVSGLFSRPRALTLQDLMAYPAVTQTITQSCISNPIGGDLIGTTLYTGARLRDVLADLGMRPEAQALNIQSADGFYESVSMQDMLDARTLLVYGMDGVTLPLAHGFPLRIYIPNRYGMKQPKWITHIEAAGQPGHGYWVDRGWSQEARPQVISMIDSVATGSAANGLVPVGGIAWAGDRGIQKVEVQVDGDAWAPARIVASPAALAWVLWRYDWPAGRGGHTLRVRATDGAGTLQDGRPADTYPNGATGYHAVAVTV